MPGLTVLTGASRGLGAALLDELLGRDEQVIVIGRGRSSAKVPPHRRLVGRIDCDLALAGEWTDESGAPCELLHLLKHMTCSLLTFLSNAGTVQPIGRVGHLPTAGLQAAIAVNFTAPALLANACLAWAMPLDIASRVIDISSGASQRPLAGWGAYCSTKAAARMFFDVQSLEEVAAAEHVDPGVMDTGMQSEIRGVERERFPDVERFRSLQIEGRLASPVDVARSIIDRHYGASSGTRGEA